MQLKIGGDRLENRTSVTQKTRSQHFSHMTCFSAKNPRYDHFSFSLAFTAVALRPSLSRAKGKPATTSYTEIFKHSSWKEGPTHTRLRGGQIPFPAHSPQGRGQAKLNPKSNPTLHTPRDLCVGAPETPHQGRQRPLRHNPRLGVAVGGQPVQRARRELLAREVRVDAEHGHQRGQPTRVGDGLLVPRDDR